MSVVRLPGGFATFANSSVLWLQEGPLLRRLDLASGEVSGWVLPDSAQLRGASPGGQKVLLERAIGWQLAWPPFSEAEVTPLSTEGGARACVLPDGGLVLASQNELLACDELGQVRWRTTSVALGELLASRDGRWLGCVHADGVAILDAGSGAPVDRVAAPSGAPLWAAAVDRHWTGWLLGVHGGCDVYWAGRTQGVFVYRKVAVPGGLASALGVDRYGRALVANVAGQLWRLGDHRGNGTPELLDDGSAAGTRVTRVEVAGEALIAQWSDGSVGLYSL